MTHRLISGTLVLALSLTGAAYAEAADPEALIAKGQQLVIEADDTDENLNAALAAYDRALQAELSPERRVNAYSYKALAYLKLGDRQRRNDGQRQSIPPQQQRAADHRQQREVHTVEEKGEHHGCRRERDHRDDEGRFEERPEHDSDDTRDSYDAEDEHGGQVTRRLPGLHDLAMEFDLEVGVMVESRQ